MSKKNIVKDTLSMGGATYLSQGIGIVTSFCMRAFLGPTLMGVWTMLQVVLGYCGYASLGVTRAMVREYPICRGGGENAKAEKLKNLTVSFSMMMSIIPAGLIIIYVLWKGDSLDPAFHFGLIFLCIFLFAQRFYDLVLNLLKSDKRFDILSQVVILNAVGMLLVVCLLVKNFGIYGLFVGVAIVTLLCLSYAISKNNYRFQWCLDKKILLDQLKLGLPLFAITFLLVFYKSLDKIFIAKFLGLDEVGLYSITMMVSSLVFALPMMLSNVLYPHTLEKFGREKSSAAIQEHLWQPILLLSTIIPFICGGVIYVMPFLIEALLPKFNLGLSAMKVYLFGIFYMLTAQFSSNVLTTLNQYMINIPIIIFSIFINVFCNIFFIKQGFGLIGIAMGTTVSFFIYGVITFIAAAANLGGITSAIAKVGRVVLLHGILFFGVYLIDFISFSASIFVNLMVKLTLLGFVSIPFIYFIDKRFKIFDLLRNLFKFKLSND